MCDDNKGSSGLSGLLPQYHWHVCEVKKKNTLCWLFLSLKIFSIFPFPPFEKGKGEINAK